MEKIRRQFIWGGLDGKGHINWVSWEKIIAPKIVGGLGLGSIFALNLALLCKWWWRLKLEPNSMWACIIRGLHHSRVTRGGRLSSASLPGIWKAIDNCGNCLEKINIRREEIIRWNEPGDRWESDFVVDGEFCVHLLRNRIDRANHWISDGFFPWHNSIPSKVACFVWRARMGRIPVYTELNRRGVDHGVMACSACIGEDESVEHLLIKCPFAAAVWNRILNWCGFQFHGFTSVRDIIDFAAIWGHGSKKR